jgi:hypothetical protein
MVQLETDVQLRYQAALDALVEKLRQDYYVLAAVLYGSLARGEAWEKSDIDLIVIVRDGVGREPHHIRHYWLVEDGINISAEIIPRSRFKLLMEGALQGSVAHSIRSQSRLLFSKDESLAAWLAESGRIGTRDQEYQLLRVGAGVPYYFDKAEKWFYVKNDLRYSFLWIMYVVNSLAQVEVVLNGEAPSREVIHQALNYNPSLFSAVYTDLIDGPKDRQAIQEALHRISAYLDEHAERLFKPVLDYLVGADGSRTITEMNARFRRKVQTCDLTGVYEWLARNEFIGKVAAPIRLTRKSQITLEEPAYFFDAGLPDWL